MSLDEIYDIKKSRMLLDVSLWSGNLTDLNSSIKKTETCADLYHLDVSDAHFVPGLLFFPDLIKAIDDGTEVLLHAHLMMENPLGHLDEFIEAGSDIITIHAELGDQKVTEIIEYLKERNLAVGLAVCVETDLDILKRYLHDLDLILLMGTPIGIKGVSMDSGTPKRVSMVKALLENEGLGDDVILSVDGGIRKETVPLLRKSGADMITPGSLVFKSEDLDGTVEWLRGLR